MVYIMPDINPIQTGILSRFLNPSEELCGIKAKRSVKQYVKETEKKKKKNTINGFLRKEKYDE